MNWKSTQFLLKRLMFVVRDFQMTKRLSEHNANTKLIWKNLQFLEKLDDICMLNPVYVNLNKDNSFYIYFYWNWWWGYERAVSESSDHFCIKSNSSRQLFAEMLNNIEFISHFMCFFFVSTSQVKQHFISYMWRMMHCWIWLHMLSKKLRCHRRRQLITWKIQIRSNNESCYLRDKVAQKSVWMYVWKICEL